MIVFTTKLTKRKIVTAIIAICVIIGSAVVIMQNTDDIESVSAMENGKINLEDKKLKTNEDRVSLLEGYGWTVDKEPMEFMEVRIPEKFDGVYNQYNEIQKKQGLDLEKYAGKRVMRYTYKINNHPSKEDGVVANLIVYKNKLIAGDICSAKLGGFMHGLAGETKTLQTEAGEEIPKEKEQN